MDRLVLVLCTLTCLWLICDARVKTGLSITFGLLLIACGCMAAMDPQVDLQRAFTIRSWGILLIGCGVFWRVSGQAIVRAFADHWPWAHVVFHMLGIDRRRARRNRT